MAVADAVRAQIAADLARAEATAVATDPPTAAHPGLDVVDAYEIQLINIGRRLDAGARVAGHKVGLASAAMQKMMNVDEPDYGHLLDDMEYFEGKPIDFAALCFPRVEVEVGFILGKDLPGEGCTRDDVVDAIEWVVPSIELIDSRIKDWKITLPDTIADNASSCGWILGEQRVAIADIDTGDIDATGEQGVELRGPAAQGGRDPARYRDSRHRHRRRRPLRRRVCRTRQRHPGLHVTIDIKDH